MSGKRVGTLELTIPPNLCYRFSRNGQFWHNALRPQSGGWLYFILPWD